MKKYTYLMTLYGMGMGMGVIFLTSPLSAAVETSAQKAATKNSTVTSDVAIPAPTPSTQTNAGAPTTAADTQIQNQWAAWMIEASQVAKEYVDDLDKGRFAESWTKGDPIFQRTITQQEWVTALNLARKRLGKANSRTLKDQKPALDPHGLPAGPYMVIEYNTSFDHAATSGELLTLRLGPDGKWRILTYQVN
jgi:hypothetical protein